MKRRELIVGGAALGALGGCAAPAAPTRTDPAASTAALRNIGFASCFDQTRQQQPIWDAILDDKPELFVFGGDNVYCRPPYSLVNLRRAYAQAAESAGLSRLRRSIPHLAIWDDHDYGANDGGAEFAGKHESKAEFLNFWKVATVDPRRGREGLYHAQTYGPPGRRVQVILLDTRWFRSPLKITDQHNAAGKERYVPDADPAKTMLGESQWRWLEEQLRSPAQVRLIVSGIQVVAEGHGWERWGNLPVERDRLYQLIGRTRAGGVMFLSGDRHIGALYRQAASVPYPIFEMTSSGITHAWREAAEAGPNRLGELVTELHFGTVGLDWDARTVRLAIKNVDGALRRSQLIRFNELEVSA